MTQTLPPRKTPLPPRVRDALETLLAYHWEHEQDHYESEPDPDHFFLILKTIRDWLDAQ